MSNDSVDIKKQFGKKLDTLFSREEIQNIAPFDRGYAMPESIVKNAVMFIGINPSFKEIHRVSHSGFYPMGQEINTGYFKRFNEIGEYCDHKWTHLDLLGIRETNQKAVIALQGKHIEFICDHLDLSKKILEESRPKVLVVCNTAARRYLGKDRHGNHNIWMGYNFGELQEDGTYRIQNSDSKLKDVPVFFSGMLTGQRALDNGSYERLQWHLKQVLK